MAGKIPRDFIQDLLQRLDIVDVVNARVPLKKKGANHMACCPFHQEKTPSFTVSQNKQFYHCFGCGAHGNAIDFMMAFDHLSFIDAVEDAAKHLGLEVPRVLAIQQAKDQAQKPLYEYLSQAQRFFQWQLREPHGQTAVDYFKNRGITGEIAKQFALGYAPDGWDHVLKAVGNTPQDQEALETVGLVIRNDKGCVYDRFRHRVMFTIRDMRGRPVGFGGRVLGDDQPKYLNSPETPVYHKGQMLYGLYEATQKQYQWPKIVVVEGYMDVIALAQFGFANAVATLGTATTQDQLRQLFKHTKHAVFCFDGDNAGRTAAWRALEVALPLMTGDYQIDFLFLPDGEDPDSLVRTQGVSAFEQRLEQALPLSTWFFDSLSKQHTLSTLEGRAKLIRTALPLLNRIPLGPFFDGCLQELATLAQTELEALQKQLRALNRKSQNNNDTLKTAPTQNPLVTRALTLLLHIPHHALDVTFSCPEHAPPAVQQLDNILRLCQEQRPSHTGAVLALFDDKRKQRLTELAGEELLLSDEQALSELQGCLDRLMQQAQHTQLENLIQRARNQPLTADEKKLLQKLLQKS